MPFLFAGTGEMAALEPCNPTIFKFRECFFKHKIEGGLLSRKKPMLLYLK